MWFLVFISGLPVTLTHAGLYPFLVSFGVGFFMQVIINPCFHLAMFSGSPALMDLPLAYFMSDHMLIIFKLIPKSLTPMGLM